MALLFVEGCDGLNNITGEMIGSFGALTFPSQNSLTSFTHIADGGVFGGGAVQNDGKCGIGIQLPSAGATIYFGGWVLLNTATGYSPDLLSFTRGQNVISTVHATYHGISNIPAADYLSILNSAGSTVATASTTDRTLMLEFGVWRYLQVGIFVDPTAGWVKVLLDCNATPVVQWTGVNTTFSTTFSGTLNGTTTVTYSPTSYVYLQPGMTVTGTNIPASTTIVSVNPSAGSFVMSHAATGSGSITVTLKGLDCDNVNIGLWSSGGATSCHIWDDLMVWDSTGSGNFTGFLTAPPMIETIYPLGDDTSTFGTTLPSVASGSHWTIMPKRQNPADAFGSTGAPAPNYIDDATSGHTDLFKMAWPVTAAQILAVVPFVMAQNTDSTPRNMNLITQVGGVQDVSLKTLPGQTVVSLSGNLSGSAQTVTALSSTASLSVGMLVQNANIAANGNYPIMNAFITQIMSSTSVNTSLSPPGSYTGVTITFTSSYYYTKYRKIYESNLSSTAWTTADLGTLEIGVGVP